MLSIARLVCGCFLFASFIGCTARPPVISPADGPLVAAIDQSLAKARHFLLSHQSPDGAWRSETYGFLKDGPSLTPHVLLSLEQPWESEPAFLKQLEKGQDYLDTLIDRGALSPPDLELIYPVYTTAEASMALNVPRGPRKTGFPQGPWLGLLRSYQLEEDLGWQPDDMDYGGWGYAQHPPRKNREGEFHGPWDGSNLSATLDALHALHTAAVSSRDPVYRKASKFVLRCQNYSETRHDAGGADGGFFFSPSAFIRNKAGKSIDAAGREYFNSYGSMTCDGLQAMWLCGLPPDDPRVVEAHGWLEFNFTAEHNPGRFNAANEDLRDATYFYYARSAAQASSRFHQRRLRTSSGEKDWAVAIAEELLKRQRPDGSWSNPFTDGREDDPLVATPMAVEAIKACRQVLAKGPYSSSPHEGVK